MRGHRRSHRWQRSIGAGAGVMALLAVAACGKSADSDKGASADSASAGGGAVPLVAVIRAADWIGTEWSEDALNVSLQDETLQAAVQRAKTVPIVFNILSDPFAAGAGTSDSSHLANVTGVYSPGFGDPEQTKRVALIKRVVPKARRLGILFSPGEPLSVGLKDKMTTAAKK